MSSPSHGIDYEPLVWFVRDRLREWEDSSEANGRVVPSDPHDPNYHSWGTIFYDGEGRLFADGRNQIDITDSYYEWVASLPLSEDSLRVRKLIKVLRTIVAQSELALAYEDPPPGPRVAFRTLCTLAEMWDTHEDYPMLGLGL